MSENVNIDLSGEMNATVEKKGLQKYVNDVELLLQHLRSGAGPALLMGALSSRRPWTQFVATENFKVLFYVDFHITLLVMALTSISIIANIIKSLKTYPEALEQSKAAASGYNKLAPASIPRLSRRFYRNIEYFQANYLVVFLGLFAYCLITSPLLLIAMVASFFGYKKLTSGPNTWKVGSWELTKTQQYAVAAACSMAVCWLAGAGAVLFWVLGATVTVVALHASFFDAESLPPSDDPERFPMVEEV